MTLCDCFTYWNDFVRLPSLLRMTLFDYLVLLEWLPCLIHLLEWLHVTTFAYWNDFVWLPSLLRMTLFELPSLVRMTFHRLTSLVRMTLCDYLNLFDCMSTFTRLNNFHDFTCWNDFPWLLLLIGITLFTIFTC